MVAGGVPKWTYRARLEIGLSGDEPGTWVRIPPPPPLSLLQIWIPCCL